MATEKVTVTIPHEVLAQARAAVEAGTASSVSAYVAQAVAQRAEREHAAGAILRRWGPFPPDVLAWARGAATDRIGRNRQAS